MVKKLKVDPAPMTLEAFQALGPERGLPRADLGKRYAEEVAALEREFGPQVPAFLCLKGRPRKGAASTPVQPRVVKMPPAFWKAMGELAEASGLTLHAAMREALLKWTQEHAHPRVG
jgi:hypothetical protein